jgi:hypothetical protein
MQQHRALILRSNRFLGSALVDKELIKAADLEAANEKFMELIQSVDSMEKASVLYTLLYELKSLDESKLIEFLIDEHKIALIDLTQIQPNSLRPMGVELSECMATWCLPFDHIEGTYLMATCYYLSAPVLRYWDEKLKGNIIWYATPMASMIRSMGIIQDLHDAEDRALEEAAAEDLAEEKAGIAAAELLAKSKIATDPNTPSN